MRVQVPLAPPEVLKKVFTFNQGRALKLRRLAEYEAKKDGVEVSTQAMLDTIVDRAYLFMQEEQALLRKNP